MFSCGETTKGMVLWYKKAHGALFLQNFLLPKPKLLIEVPPRRPVPFIFHEPQFMDFFDASRPTRAHLDT